MSLSFNFHPMPYKVGELSKFHNKGQLEFTSSLPSDSRLWSQLIESMILGLPIGAFILTSSPSGNFLILDGSKRISIVEHFVKGNFKLQGLEVLQSLNGRTCSTLPNIERNKVEDYQVYALRTTSSPVDYVNKILSHINNRL